MTIKPVEPVLIDWFYVLLDIQRKGYTPQTISMAIDVARTTILNWRDHEGAPRHSDGEKLIYLWASVTGQPREALPRKPKQLSGF